MSNLNEIKTRCIILEVENPSIRKTVEIWKYEIQPNESSSTVTYIGEWNEQQLVVKYLHPKHEELVLSVYLDGVTKLMVRSKSSKDRGMYCACDLGGDEYLGVRIV